MGGGAGDLRQWVKKAPLPESLAESVSSLPHDHMMTCPRNWMMKQYPWLPFDTGHRATKATVKKEANVRISNWKDQEGETAVQLELLLLQILVRAVSEEVGEASGFRAVPSFPGCDRPVETSLRNCCTRKKAMLLLCSGVRCVHCSQVVSLRLCRCVGLEMVNSIDR